MEVNLEEIKEEVKKLDHLLDSGEVGIGSWWMFLDERMKNDY